MKESNDLVSIIVITYNSVKYVVETLESAKAQSYKNIELIVSDDCSKDSTIEICKQWLAANKTHFISTELITTKINTGIAPNANRGLAKAKGQWVKLIAGDDILLPNCIEDNYNMVKKNGDIRVLFSSISIFRVVNGKKELKQKFPEKKSKFLFNAPAKEQLANLIEEKFICPAPASFIHTQTLLNLGAYDEAFPFFEDFPLWLRCVQNNISLFYFDIETVLYRHEESITRTGNRWISKLYFTSVKHHFYKKVAPELKLYNKWAYWQKNLYFFKVNILVKIFRNQRNFFSKSFNYIFDIVFLNKKYVK